MIVFPTEMVEALNQPHVDGIFAIRLDWPQGFVRLHSALGDFAHLPFDQGETYVGTGSLGSIGEIQYGDGDETKPSVTLELSAFDDATREQVLAGGYQGRKGVLYMLAMEQTGQVKAWCELFSGVMDSATIKQGEQNVISLPLVSPDDGLDVGLNWRCTNESHQAMYPGDEIYLYSAHMEDYAIYWANKKDGIPLRNFV